MQNDKWFWVPWLVGILGGGAMGALITAFVTYRRNKRQPITQKIEFFPVLHRTPNFPSLRAILMDETNSGSGPGVTVENLYLGRVTIINQGNQDIPEFRFGVTLTGEDEAINVITETPDRHHSMALERPVSLANPSKELDFVVKPFNRKEPYIANIYFRTKDIHSDILLSSSHSSQFVDARGPINWKHAVFDAVPLISGLTIILMMVSMLLAIFTWRSAKLKNVESRQEGATQQQPLTDKEVLKKVQEVQKLYEELKNRSPNVSSSPSPQSSKL